MIELERADGTGIAYEHGWGMAGGPTIVFLPGYASDMSGEKATALADWAMKNGRATLRFDYAGCGRSGGDFAAQTLTDWRDDALLAIDKLTGRGPLLLVGSSMGGWIALLVALKRPARIAGIVGIAAAPDFTEWGFDAEARATLERDGRIETPSIHAEAPMVTTRAFWESGQANLVLDKPFPLAAPVRLLHGQADGDVPWTTALRLADTLMGKDVRVTLIKDGDHRLSRPQDIALLIDTVAKLVEAKG